MHMEMAVVMADPIRDKWSGINTLSDRGSLSGQRDACNVDVFFVPAGVQD